MADVEEMKPWEQHSEVIIIPRFDYNAPSSLLSHSLSGFLITCTFKREKSATKEAMSILGKYLGSCTSSDNSGENTALKRRKTNTEDMADKADDNEDGDGDQSGNSLSSATVETSERNSVLSLVKLTRSGLLLFTFSRDTSFDTVSVVLDVLRSLESQGSASPQWCHRILPIQATCSLNEKELGATVSKLVCDFVSDKHYSLARPLKFAVGYNRRGYEETEAKKLPKGDSKSSNSSTLLDRNTCFSIVGSAVNGVVPHSVVDLKSPEISVLVELLPLSGVPNGSFVAGVSVLPESLVSTKPRLCVKSLVSSAKAKA